MQETNAIKTGSAKIWGILGISLALGVIFDYLFFDHGMGINFFVYVIVALGSVFFVFNLNRVKYNPKGLWYLVPIFFFSAMVFVRSSEFLTFWNVVFTLALILIFLYQVLGFNISDMHLLDYIKPFVRLPFKFAGRALKGLAELVTGNRIVGSSDASKRVVRGIIITIPVVLFFLMLFSSADLAFGKYLSDIFNFHISEEAVVRTIEIAIITTVFLGVLLYLAENTTQNGIPVSHVMEPKNAFGRVEAYILFGALNAVFFLFLLVQLRYLFAGHEAITRLGYTYAEYARRGFNELIIVAIFSFLLLWAADRYIEKTQNSKAFPALSLILIAQVLVILVSAFLRDKMYADAYGLTEIRFYTYVFISWLGAIFLLLAYKISTSGQESKLAFSILIVTLIWMAGLNYINPEAVIARKNLDRYRETGKLDAQYLGMLSYDAFPQLIVARNVNQNIADDGLREVVDGKIKRLREGWNGQGSWPWQSFNISRQRALNIIK